MCEHWPGAQDVHRLVDRCPKQRSANTGEIDAQMLSPPHIMPKDWQTGKAIAPPGSQVVLRLTITSGLLKIR